MKFAHPAFWVSDIEATRDFYLDGLGLEYSTEFESTEYYPGSKNLYVRDEDGVELQFKYDYESAPSGQGGFDHIAFAVDDVDETFERVVDATGCTVIEEPVTMEGEGLRIAFIEDPDGYRVELFEHV